MRTPRFFRWLSANARGYFWLPCPICGRNFGGNEPGAGMLMHSWSNGTMTCPDCAVEAERRNQEFYKKNPFPPVVINL
jgi:hypothetical protein